MGLWKVPSAGLVSFRPLDLGGVEDLPVGCEDVEGENSVQVGEIWIGVMANEGGAV